jgi:hypothetical protein
MSGRAEGSYHHPQRPSPWQQTPAPLPTTPSSLTK